MGLTAYQVSLLYISKQFSKEDSRIGVYILNAFEVADLILHFCLAEQTTGNNWWS